MISLTSPIETPFHRLPAGAKLAALSAFTCAIFLSGTLWVHGFAVVLVGVLYLIGGRTFACHGLRGLRPLLPFLLLIALWHLVTGTPGQGLIIAFRLLAVFGLANLVTMTTRLSDMIAVLRWLTTPLRRIGIRTGPLEIAIALVIRFIPVLAQKGAQLVESWRSRSPRRPGWRIIAPFALLAIDDADHVAEALRARGGIQ